MDRTGNYLYANDAACTMTGFERGELLARTVFDLDPELTPDIWRQRWETYKQRGSITYETRHHRKDGGTFPVEVTTTYLEFYGKAYLCSFVRDTTERTHAAAQLRQLNEQLTRQVNELEQRNRDITLLNRMSKHMQGCQTVADVYQVFVQDAAQLFSGLAGVLYVLDTHTNYLTGVAAWGQPALALDQLRVEARRVLHGQWPNTTLSANTLHLAGNGDAPHTSWVSISVPLTTPHAQLGVLCLLVKSDAPIDQRIRWERLAVTVADYVALTLTNLHLRERLRDQAIRDALTGLFNRYYLEEHLSRFLKREAHVGVILLDVDHFKRYNTNHGLGGGDAALQTVGAFLRDMVTVDGFACRYGGEEFIVVLPGDDLEAVYAHAEQIRLGLSRLSPVYRGQQLAQLTASLGVAAAPEHGSTINDVLGAADQALSMAKAQGRDRVVVGPLPYRRAQLVSKWTLR
jgi:diguanylate cyclase (GGDEF)-like protein/PAS domain S-box-containing protein